MVGSQASDNNAGRYTNPFHVIRAHPMQLGIIDMQACQQVTVTRLRHLAYDMYRARWRTLSPLGFAVGRAGRRNSTQLVPDARAP